MNEFNKLDEKTQYEYLKLHTNKNVILLTQPVFVHEGCAYPVDNYKFDRLEDFIKEVNDSPKNNLYFYSVNHYKELEMSVNEYIMLTNNSIPPHVRFSLV